MTVKSKKKAPVFKKKTKQTKTQRTLVNSSKSSPKGKLKLGTKIILQIVLILTVVLGLAFAFIIENSIEREQNSANENIKVVSEKNAATVKSTLEEPLLIARQLAYAMEGYRNLDVGIRRDYYNSMMTNILEKNENIFGIWAGWEPNAIDAMDAAYAGRRPDTDGTGRHLPYIVRTENGIDTFALEDYDIDGAGDYYLLARYAGRETILEPFEYNVAGETVLMTSLAVPIRNPYGDVIGVAGVDITLDTLQSLVFDTGIYENTQMVAATHQGNILIHPEIEMINADMEEILSDEQTAETLELIKTGQAQTIQDVSKRDGNNVQMIFTPVIIGQTGTPWSTALIVRSSDISEASDRVLYTLVLILILVLVIISVFLFIAIRVSVSKPIRKTLQMINDLAKGKLSTRLNIRKYDEVGQMAKAMDRFADDLQNKVVTNMNLISEGNINMSLSMLSDEDEITPALKRMVDAIKSMLGDVNMLSAAALEGQLSTRAETDKHGGEFKNIVEGFNNTLDAVITPLNTTAVTIQNLADGLDTEAVENIYKGDFADLIDHLNQVVLSIKSLISESGNLVDKAIEGDLSFRADTSKLKGNYAAIVSGVNKTLDAIIEPIEEATSVLDKMSVGDLSARVEGDYNGDHSRIKQALNSTLDELSAYIKDISRILTGMATANLDQEISIDYKGDFNEIQNSLVMIIDAFNRILFDFNQGADMVASGARQVSDASMSLSQGTTEQASSIQELTASVSEIASQTKHNAENASSANRLVYNMQESAETGHEQMSKMLEAMSNISSTSSDISRIIKVIDDIAFQTNILALNAAVEAARAGQHGRGFAVVAEEVRNLAGRSAQAAKETSELIEGTIKAVDEGSELAVHTGDALNQIVSNIEKAVSLVGEIADSSNSQASAIAQINQGVSQVSKVVQANSATSEQSAAASEELSNQADQLKNQVNRFIIKNQ